MFARALRRNAALGAAVLSVPVAAMPFARSEQRVYVSGEALGRGVRLEYWKAKHENVVVLDLESELIQLGMTRIRDRENEGKRFIHDANSVLRAAIDLAITELPNDEEAVVVTPRGHKAEGVVFEDDVKVCGIAVGSNVEVQKSLLSVLEGTLPFESALGDVLIAETAKGDARVVKANLPEDLDGYEVLLLVPDFNALEKISKTIHLLRQAGVEEEKLTVVTLVTCPEAADKFCQTFGDARLVTASFDAARDGEGFIVPGIGAFEDRYLGAPSPYIELPEEDESSEAGDDESDLKAKLTNWWPFKG
ncbi:hypothetical protein Poli38472_003970 [Pythium oligandrum]|uniref:Phosphoribosyltransferase domain-containing protein n=1 Tax=Pythium oligandrum TaxID=41045 RepID=A0A8K1CMT7_PYTOL|nr:hypothetical protein Poli38472_003970 [Pythium oligandrum]|eukprot:TMW66205.1 hypothetical protein Poli38472_003970 [Pythium oligandrum]